LPIPLAIPLPRPFDVDWMLDFLRARAVSSMEMVPAGRYVRAVRIQARPVTIAVSFESRPRSVLVRSSPEIDPAALERLARTIFDLDTDLSGFLEIASRDRFLKRSAATRPGLRVPHFVDPLEGMLRAIVGQQVGVRAASTMIDRIVRAFGSPAPPFDNIHPAAFPAAEDLLGAGPDRIVSLGLTRAKAAAICAVARAASEGRLEVGRLRSLAPEIVERDLCSIPGVGPWTATYFRMRTLGDSDACPTTDLGVVKAVRSLSPRGAALRQADIARRAERWRPWRAYATLHLWNSLASPTRPTQG
jgi:3-methyladenine DNA glycosylase/8-oxoguanine DNA glycosylase